MRPINDYLFDPDPGLGGAIIPVIGMPGSGKTVFLIQLGINAVEKEHIPIWRGTKQAQWIGFLANDIPVTVWNHEALEGFEAFITAENPEDSPVTVDLEEHDVEIKEWSDPEELINSLETDRVNVVNVPGLQGDTGNTDHHLYFFRKTWGDIFEALVDRKWLRFVTFMGDEWGDIVPSQQELRKPFYSIVSGRLPSIFSQLRKQNCFLFGASHSTNDTHYFFWKNKANSIIYMSGANVKYDVSPQVDQKIVSKLGRGEFVMPPYDKEHVELPYQAKDLDWIPDNPHKVLRLSWRSEAPNLLPWSVEGEKSEKQVKKELVSTLYDSELGLSYRDLADVFDVAPSTIGDWIKDVKEDDDD